MNYIEFLKERLKGIFGDALFLVHIQYNEVDQTVYVKCEPTSIQIAEEVQEKLGELMCDFEDTFPGMMLSFVREDNIIQFMPHETHVVSSPIAVTFEQHNNYMICTPFEQLITVADNVAYYGNNPTVPYGTLELVQVISVINGSIVVTTDVKPFSGFNSSPVNSAVPEETKYQTNSCSTCIAA